MHSLYGNYRQLKFTDVFEDKDTFIGFLSTCGLQPSVTTENLTTLYYLLYARYGNSVVASSDINQFQYKVAAIIFNEGHVWQKKLEIQRTLSEMTIEEAQVSGKGISSHAYNPGEQYDLDSEGILQTINDQNVNTQKVSPVVAAQLLYQSVEDVTTSFINKFADLFLKFVAPEQPLWYVTDDDEE